MATSSIGDTSEKKPVTDMPQSIGASARGFSSWGFTSWRFSSSWSGASAG